MHQSNFEPVTFDDTRIFNTVVTWSTEPPKFKRKYSKDGEANPYAIKSRPGSTEVSLLTHDEEEESFKPTDAGMAAALGFMM